MDKQFKGYTVTYEFKCSVMKETSSSYCACSQKSDSVFHPSLRPALR